MHGLYLLKYLILYLTIIKSIHTLEIFISKTNSPNDTAIESLASYENKSYELSLFQRCYVTIRCNTSDLYSNTSQSDHRVVGFKFQAKSSDIHVVNIRKELTALNNTSNVRNIIIEDLFILPKSDALGHIFNAYPSPTLTNLDDPTTISTTWSVEGMTMEVTNLTFILDIFYDDDTRLTREWPLTILVKQPNRLLDKIFYIILPFLVTFISIQMGILLDTKVLLHLTTNPKPVLIGFVSQYGLMPFLAMAIAKVFHYSPLYSLSLFIVGCCPGSGASNQWTLLFDGDVNLSALMSFLSTTASFVMMPLYFYTIGRIYMRELSISVPFIALLRSLGLVVIPYGIGIVISHYSPKTHAIVKVLVKPMMLFLLLFFLVFGTVVNWYLIVSIDLYTALTAPLLPYLGFILGALLAKLFCLSWKHVKTVGIEAGIQNTGIAFMVMLYSFPQPYATKAIVVPLVVAFLTTKPFWVIYVIRSRVKKWQKTKELIQNEVKANQLKQDEKTNLETLKSFTNDESNHVKEILE